MDNTPEWLRLVRGLPAYLVCRMLQWAHLALLPYAGDWMYRHDRREARDMRKVMAVWRAGREKVDG